MKDPIVVPRELLESLADEDDCSFDHHGGCQTHGYLSLQPGELCPQQEAKRLLAEDAPGLHSLLERTPYQRHLIAAVLRSVADGRERYTPPWHALHVAAEWIDPSTEGPHEPDDDAAVIVPSSLIGDVVYDYQQFVSPAGYLDNRAHHLVELANRISDLKTYHPGFDSDTGTMPWERDDDDERSTT